MPINMNTVTAVVLADAPVPTTEGAIMSVNMHPKSAMPIVVHSCCWRRPNLSANQPESGMKRAKTGNGDQLNNQEITVRDPQAAVFDLADTV